MIIEDRSAQKPGWQSDSFCAPGKVLRVTFEINLEISHFFGEMLCTLKC